MRTAVIRTASSTLVVIALATAASAQVVERPPRSTGGLFGGRQPADPNRTRQELSMTVDFLGGYDDNVLPDGDAAPSDPSVSARSGVTGTVSASMSYRRGRATRGIEATGRAVVNSFRNIGVRPLFGSQGTLRAFAQLFGRTQASIWAQGDYQPTFMFGTTAAGPGAMPAADPTGGVTELRSVNSSAVSSLTHNWSSRQRTEASYSYARTRFLTGGGTNLDDHTLQLGHTWDFMRNAGVQSSYRFSHALGEQLDAGGRRPVDSQTVTLGLEIRRPLSRTRRLTFSGGAGAVHVETRRVTDGVPVEYVAPSGFGSARMDLGRTWSVSGDVRRDVTMLEGITRQSFLTTTATIWTGGEIGRSWAVATTTTYSDGAPDDGDVGSFKMFGGTFQLTYALARCCSAVTSYSYYQHHLRDVAAVAPGFPRTFERNTARVGLTVWLPLYGTFPGGRRR